jgi:hypothetical protein
MYKTIFRRGWHERLLDRILVIKQYKKNNKDIKNIYFNFSDVC